MNVLVDNLFAQLIKRALGAYFENGSSEYDRVELDIWSGDITLENLKVKKNILDSLNIPIRLLLCSLKRIHLRIPWGRFNSEPIVVEIDGICVLLEPNYSVNAQSKAAASQAKKYAKLLNTEFFVRNIDAGVGPKHTPAWLQSFKEMSLSFLMNSVIADIIRNIQIEVRNIHIRYEDQQSCPISSFCAGFMLESFVIASKQDSDQIAESGQFLLDKMITITRQAMYWNPLSVDSAYLCNKPLAGKLDSDIERIMLQRLFVRCNQQQSTGPQGHRFILLPMNMETSIQANLDLGRKNVEVSVSVVIPTMDTALDDQQGMEIIAVSSNITNYLEMSKNSEMRPTVSARANPKAWWRYAIHSILIQGRRCRKGTSSRELQLYSLLKAVYIELWSNNLTFPSSDIELKKARKVIQLEAEQKLFGQDCGMDVNDLMIDIDSPLLLFVASTSRKRRILMKRLREISHASNLGSSRQRVSKINYSHLQAKLELRPLGKLSPEQLVLLARLEYVLSFEEIVYFRALAEIDVSSSTAETKPGSWFGDIVSWATGKAHQSDKRLLSSALHRDDVDIFAGRNSVAASVSESANSASEPGPSNAFRSNISISLVVGSSTVALSFAQGYEANVNVVNIPAPKSSTLWRSVYQPPRAFIKIISKRIILTCDIQKTQDLNVTANFSVLDMEIWEPSSVAQLCSMSSSPIQYSPFSIRNLDSSKSPWIHYQGLTAEKSNGIMSSSTDESIDNTSTPLEQFVSLTFSLQRPGIYSGLSPVRRVEISIGGTSIFIHKNSPVLLLFDSFADRAGWYGEPRELRNLCKKDKSPESIHSQSTKLLQPPDPKQLLKENVSFAVGNRSDTQLSLKMASAMVYIAVDRSKFDSQTGEFLVVRGGDLVVSTQKKITKPITYFSNLLIPGTLRLSTSEMLTDFPIDTVVVDEISLTMQNTCFSLETYDSGLLGTKMDFLNYENCLTMKIILQTTLDVPFNVPWLRMEVNHSGVKLAIDEHKIIALIRCTQELAVKPTVRITSKLAPTDEPSANNDEQDTTDARDAVEDDELAFFDPLGDLESTGDNHALLVADSQIGMLSGESSTNVHDDNILEDEDSFEFFDAVDDESLTVKSQILTALRERCQLLSPIEINREIRCKEEVLAVLLSQIAIAGQTDYRIRDKIIICEEELSLLRDIYGNTVVAEIKAANMFYPVQSRKKGNNVNSGHVSKVEESVRLFLSSMGKVARWNTEQLMIPKAEKKIFYARKTEKKHKRICPYDINKKFQLVHICASIDEFEFRLLSLNDSRNGCDAEILCSRITGIKTQCSVWTTDTAVRSVVENIEIFTPDPLSNRHRSILTHTEYSPRENFETGSRTSCPFTEIYYSIGTSLSKMAGPSEEYVIEKKHVASVLSNEMVCIADQDFVISLLKFMDKLNLLLSSLPPFLTSSSQSPDNADIRSPSHANQSKIKKISFEKFSTRTEFDVNISFGGLRLIVKDATLSWDLLVLRSGAATVTASGQTFQSRSELLADIVHTLPLGLDLDYSISLDGVSFGAKAGTNADFKRLLYFSDIESESVNRSNIGDLPNAKFSGAIRKSPSVDACVIIQSTISIQRTMFVLDISPAISVCEFIANSPLISFLNCRKSSSSLPHVDDKKTSRVKRNKSNNQTFDLVAMVKKIAAVVEVESGGIIFCTAPTFDIGTNSPIAVPQVNFGIKSITAAICLGSAPALYKGCEVLSDISVAPFKIDDSILVEGFHLLSSLAVSVNTCNGGKERASATVVSSEILRKLRFAIEKSMFRPIAFTFIGDREAIMSSSITPIVISVTDQMIITLLRGKVVGGKLAEIIMPHITSLRNISVQSGSDRCVQSEQINSIPIHGESQNLPKYSKLLLRDSSDNPANQETVEVLNAEQWSFVLSLTAFEIAVQFLRAEQPLTGRTINENMPLFCFLTRGLELLVVGSDPRRLLTNSALVPGSNSQTIPLILHSEVDISSFDVYCNTWKNRIKRLVYSDSDDQLNCFSNRQYSSIDGLQHRERDSLKLGNVVMCTVDVSNDLQIDIDSKIQNINVVIDCRVIVDCLKSVQEVCARCLASIDVESRVNGVDSEQVDEVRSAVHSEPLASPIPEYIGDSLKSDLSSDGFSGKTATLLVANSLTFPLSIKSIELKFNAEENGIWIPGKNCHELDESENLRGDYLYLTAASSLTIGMFPVGNDSNIFLPSVSNSSTMVDAVTIACDIGPMEVYFTQSISSLAFEPITSIEEIFQIAMTRRPIDSSEFIEHSVNEFPLVGMKYSDVMPYLQAVDERVRSDSIESLCDEEDNSWLKGSFYSKARSKPTSNDIDSVIVGPVVGKLLFVCTVVKKPGHNRSNNEAATIEYDSESSCYAVTNTLDARFQPIEISVYLSLIRFTNLYKENIKHLVEYIESMKKSTKKPRRQTAAPLGEHDVASSVRGERGLSIAQLRKLCDQYAPQVSISDETACFEGCPNEFTIIGVNKINIPKSLFQALPTLLKMGSISVSVTIEQLVINIIDNWNSIVQPVQRAAINTFRMAFQEIRLSSKFEALPKGEPILMSDSTRRIVFSDTCGPVNVGGSDTITVGDSNCPEVLSEHKARIEVHFFHEIEYFAADTMTWNTLIDQFDTKLNILIPWPSSNLSLKAVQGPIFWRILHSAHPVRLNTDIHQESGFRLLPSVPVMHTELDSSSPSRDSGSGANRFLSCRLLKPSGRVTAEQNQPVLLCLQIGASFNLNICPDILSSVIAIGSKLKLNLPQDGQSDPQLKYGQAGNFVIKNQTGTSFECWTESQQFARTIPAIGTIPYDISHQVDDRNLNMSKRLDPLLLMHRTVSIKLDGICYNEIPIVGSGRRLLSRKGGLTLDQQKLPQSSLNGGTATGAVDYVLQLSTMLGVKTLSVRSTLLFKNSLDQSIRLALISAHLSPIYTKISEDNLLWAATVPQGNVIGLPVAADGTIMETGIPARLVMLFPQGSIEYGEKKFAMMDILLPQFQSNEISTQSKEENEMSDFDLHKQNYLCHRRASISQKKSKPAHRHYCHWLAAHSDTIENRSASVEVSNLTPSDAWSLVTQRSSTAKSDSSASTTLVKKRVNQSSVEFNANVLIDIYSDLHSPSGRNSTAPEIPTIADLIQSASAPLSQFDPLSRIVTLSAPLKIRNLLAGNLSVRIESTVRHGLLFFGSDKHKKSTSFDISSGGSAECLLFHATESITVFVDIATSSENTTEFSGTNQFTVDGCHASKVMAATTSYANIIFPNRASLCLHCDISELDGIRSLSFYVPFWIVCPARMLLSTKHCSNRFRPLSQLGTDLNGDDMRAGDQYSGLFCGTTSMIQPETNGDLVVSNNDFSVAQVEPISNISQDNPDCDMCVIHMSYSNYDVVQSYVSISLPGFDWSEGFSLENVPSKITLSGIDNEAKRVKYVSLSSRLAERTEGKSKVITIMDKYAFQNRSTTSVEIRQSNASEIVGLGGISILLTPGSNEPYYFPWRESRTGDGPVIAFRVLGNEEAFGWSADLDVHSFKKSVSFPVCLVNSSNSKAIYVTINVTVKVMQVIVDFTVADKCERPIILENYCTYPVRYGQVGATNDKNLLEPFYRSSYCWADSQSKAAKFEFEWHHNNLLQQSSPDQQSSEYWNSRVAVSPLLPKRSVNKEMTIDCLGEFGDEQKGFLRIFSFYAKATQVIVLVDCDAMQERIFLWYLLHERMMAAAWNHHRIQISLSLPSISVCVANREDAMLIMTTKDVSLSCSVAQSTTSNFPDSTESQLIEVGASIGGVQVEFQLLPLDTELSNNPGANVMLQQYNSDFSSTTCPVFGSRIRLETGGSRGVLFIPTLEVAPGPLMINFSGSMALPLFKILLPWIKIGKEFTAQQQLESISKVSPRNSLVQFAKATFRVAPPRPSPSLFFKKFTIDKIHYNISFDPALVALIPIRATFKPLKSFLTALIQGLSTLGTLQRCDLLFSSMTVFECELNQALKLICSSILSQLPSQLKSVAISLPAFAKPVEIIQLLSTGFSDFVKLPFSGAGLGSGVASFARHVTASALVTSSLMTSAVESVFSISAEMAGSDELNLIESIEASTSDQEINVEHAEIDNIGQSQLIPSASISIQPPSGKRLPVKSGGIVSKFIARTLGAGLLSLSNAFSITSVLLQTSAEALVLPAQSSKGARRAMLAPTSLSTDQHLFIHRFNRMSFDTAIIPQRHIHHTDIEFGPELLARALLAYRRAAEIYLLHVSFVDYTTLILTNKSVLLVRDTFGSCDVLWSYSIRDLLLLDVDYNYSDMFAFVDVSVVSNAAHNFDSNAASSRRVIPFPSFHLSDERSPNMQSPSRTISTAISPTSSPKIIDSVLSQSTSSSTSSLSSPQLLLKGKPISEIISHHTRLRLRALTGCPTLKFHHKSNYPRNSRPSKTTRTGRATSPIAAGLRLSMCKIKFNCHEQLVDFLICLLSLSPCLLSDQIASYLTRCGMDPAVLTV